MHGSDSGCAEYAVLSRRFKQRGLFAAVCASVPDLGVIAQVVTKVQVQGEIIRGDFFPVTFCQASRREQPPTRTRVEAVASGWNKAIM